MSHGLKKLHFQQVQSQQSQQSLCGLIDLTSVTQCLSMISSDRKAVRRDLGGQPLVKPHGSKFGMFAILKG